MSTNTEMDKEKVFREYSVPKALRIMVVPAVISQLIVLIYNMADTFYSGPDRKSLYDRGYVADPACI